MKKHFLRILTVLMLVCFGACLLVACGGDETNADNNVDNGSQTPATYTVTYADGIEDAEVAVPTDTTAYQEGATVTVKAGIEYTGKEFKGWSDGTTVYQPNATFSMPAHDVTLTATWGTASTTPKTKYQVTLNYEQTNGVTVTLDPELPAGGMVEEGTVLTLTVLCNPGSNKTIDKVTVNGSEITAKSSGVYEITVDGAKAIVVTFKNTNTPSPTEEHTVTYAVGTHAAEGATVTPSSEETVNGKVTLPAAPEAATGYEFTGWKVGDDAALKDPQDEITVTADVTVTAQWKFAMEGVWEGTLPDNTSDDAPAIPAALYIQSTDGVVDTIKLGGGIDSDELHIHALVLLKTTSAGVSTTIIAYVTIPDDADTVLLTVPLMDGAQFALSLSTDGLQLAQQDAGSAQPATFTSQGAIPAVEKMTAGTLYGYRADNNVYLKNYVVGANGDTITVDDNASKLYYIGSFAIPYTEEANGEKWQLGGVVYAKETNGNYSVFDFESSVTLETVAPVTLTITNKNNDSQSETEQYKPGTQYTLEEPGNIEGYTFGGWKVGSDNTPKNAGTKITLNEATTITAVWNRVKHTVHYVYEEGAQDTAPADEEKEEGATVTLTQPAAKKGYRFTEWEVQGAALETDHFTVGTEDVTVTAKFAPIEYTLHFADGKPADASGEVQSVPSDITVTLKDATKSLGQPTLADYNFAGWKLNEEHTYKDSFTLDETLIGTLQGGNTTFTLTAQWTEADKTYYNVTFKTGYGENTVITTKNVEEGKTVDALPTNPERKGYTFDKWVIDGEETTEFTAQTQVTKELTVKATWNAVSYTIKFVVNAPDGKTVSGIEGTEQTITVSLESTAIAIPTLSLKGYTYEWKKDGTKFEATTFTEGMIPEGTTEITVTAQWTAKTYTVTYDLNKPSGEKGTLSPESIDSGEIAFDASLTLPENPTRTGYTFDGWQIEGHSDLIKKTEEITTLELADDMIPASDEAITFTAKWTMITYVLKYASGVAGDEDVSGMPVADGEISWAADLTLPDDPNRTDYNFDGWKVEGKADTVKKGNTLTLDDAIIEKATSGDEGKMVITLTAQWKPVTYTVTYEKGDHAAEDASVPNETTVPKGTKHTLATAPKAAEGWEFTGWKVNDDADNLKQPNDTIDINEDTTITAQWQEVEEETYAVKYDEGLTFADGTPETKNYAESAQVTLSDKKPTKDGYTFKNWKVTKDGGGEVALEEGGNSFTMPAEDVTVTAEWTKDPVEYTFKFYENKGDGEAKTTKTETLADGVHVSEDTVNTSITKTNYTFEGWFYEKEGEHKFDTEFIPSDYGSTTIEIYAKWTLNDEITVDDLTATDYTRDVPLYTYEGGLHKGDAVTISGNLTFTKGTGALVHEGILGYFSQSDGITGATKKYIIARYDYCFNNTSATKAPAGGDNQDAMPELKWTLTKHVVAFSKIVIGDWFAAYSALIKRAGATFEFELEYDYTTEGVVFISYVIKNPTEFTYTYGDAGANSQTVPAGSEFIMRYAVTASEGQLADDFVIALGGEQAKLANVTLKRVQNAHIHTGTDTCDVCGKSLVKSEEKTLNLTNNDVNMNWAQHIAEQTTGDYTAAPGRDLHITGEFGVVGANFNGFAFVIAEKTSKEGVFFQYSSGTCRIQNDWTTFVDGGLWNLEKRIVNGGFAAPDVITAEKKDNHQFELILTYDGERAKLTIITYSDEGVTAADTRIITCNIKGSEVAIGIGLDAGGTTDNVKNVKYFTVTAQDAD